MCFTKLDRDTFTAVDFQALSTPWAQLLWLYVLTTPRQIGTPGLLRVTTGEMLADLGWAARLGDEAAATLDAALAELGRVGLLRYDAATGILLVPKTADMHLPANPSMLAHWRRPLVELPRCGLVTMWVEMMRRKLDDVDSMARSRLGGQAWRSKAYDELLADVDAAYAPPMQPLDEFLSDEELARMGLERKPPTPPTPYRPLSRKVRKALAEAQQQRAAEAALNDGDEPAVTFDGEMDALSAALRLEICDVPAAKPAPADGAESGRRARERARMRQLREDTNGYCHRLVQHFLIRLREAKPDCKLPTDDALDGWYDDMDKMLRVDKRHVDAIGQLIDWVTEDEFEAANVRCPRKLRQRFDQLEVKKRAAEAKQRRASAPPPAVRREEPAYPECFGKEPEPVRRSEGDLTTPEQLRRVFEQHEQRRLAEKRRHEELMEAERLEVKRRDDERRAYLDAQIPQLLAMEQEALARETRAAQDVQKNVQNEDSKASRLRELATAVAYVRCQGGNAEPQSVAEILEEAQRAGFHPSERLLAETAGFAVVDDEESN